MTLAHDPAPDAALLAQRLDDAIFAMAARAPYAAGEEIFGQGEEADLVYQLVRGTVRLRCFARGAWRTLETLDAPGCLFGLDPGPEHEMSAEAVTDCAVRIASRRGLAFALGQAGLQTLLAPEMRRKDGRPEGRAN